MVFGVVSILVQKSYTGFATDQVVRTFELDFRSLERDVSHRAEISLVSITQGVIDSIKVEGRKLILVENVLLSTLAFQKTSLSQEI